MVGSKRNKIVNMYVYTLYVCTFVLFAFVQVR